MTNHKDSWDKALHPKTLRNNMINIAIFVMAFETFRDVVVSKLKYFFADSYSKKGPKTGIEYKSEVSKRHNNALQASMLWFQEMGAIDETDMQTFQTIRKHRNELVHELADFLTEANREYDPHLFNNLISLISKIDIWWIENIELSTDQDKQSDGENSTEVISGTKLLLQLISDIALGNEPHEGYYYEQFRRMRT